MAQDDPDGTFGPMNRGDVVKNFVQYAPIKSGSAYYKRPTSEQAFPVYVEKIIVREVDLQPRTARRSCSCSLERAGIFTTARRCHGMLAPSRQRDK